MTYIFCGVRGTCINNFAGYGKKTFCTGDLKPEQALPGCHIKEPFVRSLPFNLKLTVASMAPSCGLSICCLRLSTKDSRVPQYLRDRTSLSERQRQLAFRPFDRLDNPIKRAIAALKLAGTSESTVSSRRETCAKLHRTRLLRRHCLRFGPKVVLKNMLNDRGRRTHLLRGCFDIPCDAPEDPLVFEPPKLGLVAADSPLVLFG